MKAPIDFVAQITDVSEIFLHNSYW